jgi:hypothetical protein
MALVPPQAIAAVQEELTLNSSGNAKNLCVGGGVSVCVCV